MSILLRGKDRDKKANTSTHTLRGQHSLATVYGGIALMGLGIIIAYAIGTSGSHLRTACVALIAAFGALSAGTLFGFLFGIPRVVSSGQLRIEAQAKDPNDSGGQQQASTSQATPSRTDPSSGLHISSFEPSTNLAEVSDWLTKLLLGAGLVDLTQLGKAVGDLIDNVAAGFASSAAAGTAKAFAGGILITYSVLGFLAGYVVTTLWYGKKLEEGH